jgi:hypothetical protein
VAARNPASAARVAISVAANRVIVADLLYRALRGLHAARGRWRSACNHTGAEREAAGDDKAGEWAFHTFSDHCFSCGPDAWWKRVLSARVPKTKKKGYVWSVNQLAEKRLPRRLAWVIYVSSNV